MKTFRGLELENKKESDFIQWTIRRSLSLPKKLLLPLKQKGPGAAIPCVAVGDSVLTGEKVATPTNEQSVAVHASCSGKVTNLVEILHPEYGLSQAIEMTCDDDEKRHGTLGVLDESWHEKAPEEYLNQFREAGLVELNRDETPVHLKAKAARIEAVDVLVINACETEPYVTTDYSLCMSHPVEILKGAEILRKTVGASRIVVAFGHHEREAAELIQSKIFFLKWEHCSVEMVSEKYPQSLDAILLRSLHQNDVAIHEDQLQGTFNPATAFAVYEAIALNKPLYERSVTMGGECTIDSGNLWVRVGTPVSEAVKMCRGFMRDPSKVVLGGPMQGTAILDLQTPVLKSTQAVLGLPPEVARTEAIEACTQCGECLEGCPVDLSPSMIVRAAEHERFDLARSLGVQQCIECGICAYVCPSKLPMIELIRVAMKGEKVMS